MEKAYALHDTFYILCLYIIANGEGFGYNDDDATSKIL